MTFEQALAIALRLGAASPSFGPDAPAAQCWIDRIAQAESIRERSGHDITNQFTWKTSLARAIAEANRYAGRQEPSTMFRDHNCWRCKSGALPCVVGNPHQCEYPHAKND